VKYKRYKTRKKIMRKNINEIRLKYPKLIKDNSFGLFFV